MSLSELEIFAIYFSLKVSLTSVAITLPLSIFTAYCLTRHNFPGKILLETLFHIPLVLPPVVTGFLLLWFTGSKSTLGHFLQSYFGLQIPFSFWAAVLAAVVVSFPLVLRPVKLSMKSIDEKYLKVSRSLGRGPLETFFHIILPLSLPGLVAGGVLGFARSFGEFGATIMFAGNIPFETTTLPLAIFSFFNRAGESAATVRLVGVAILIALVSLGISEYMQRKIEIDA